MWHWDQGRLEYFQFDALRQIASYVVNNDFKSADRNILSATTGLPFAPVNYTPWRNYSRVLKLMLLVSEEAGIAKATPVAFLLSNAGAVTCDEYLHFLLCAFTEPSPALTDWQPNAFFRYPLLFAIKYLLAKTGITNTSEASLDEILGAYIESKFIGGEGQEQFIAVVNSAKNYEAIGRGVTNELRRQAKESLKVVSQISYLNVHSDKIIVSLNPTDAQAIFDDLAPITGRRSNDRNAEIRRLASLFKGGSTLEFDYPNTIIETVVESGFREGNKIKKTHITIERNSGLRRQYFEVNPTPICDICLLNTKKSYPWVERILDIHHLLPLCSGTRVQGQNTMLSDLVPVCPNCHRAVHRFYDTWLDRNNRKDFVSGLEAKNVYQEIKTQFTGLII
ncbi:MAG: HNH endonuclease [Mucilaginibacter sp.]